MSLSKQKIFEAKRKIVTVHIEGLGGEVSIRPLNVSAFAKLTEAKNIGSLAPLMAMHSVCDDQGALLFTEEDLADIENLPVEALLQLAEHVTRINGLDRVKPPIEPNPSP